MNASRIVMAYALASSLMFNIGCASLWDELNPRRLNKLNQGPPPPEARDFSLQTRSHQIQFVKRQLRSREATILAQGVR